MYTYLCTYLHAFMLNTPSPCSISPSPSFPPYSEILRASSVVPPSYTASSFSSPPSAPPCLTNSFTHATPLPQNRCFAGFNPNSSSLVKSSSANVANNTSTDNSPVSASAVDEYVKLVPHSPQKVRFTPLSRVYVLSAAAVAAVVVEVESVVVVEMVEEVGVEVEVEEEGGVFQCNHSTGTLSHAHSSADVARRQSVQ